jgi:glycosyltransferase involved in cell wall biosynthesis
LTRSPAATGRAAGDAIAMPQHALNGLQKPWLSAIVPSHNGERWLAAAFESVRTQADPGIEVIVVDSSDTAESLEIAQRFAGELDLKIHRRPERRSWMEKTNFGVGIARAGWICMLHQDDLWLPGRCSQIKRWLAAQSDAVMHLHDALIIDKSGKRLGRWRCPLPASEGPVSLPLMLERLLVQEFIAIPTPTIRRDAYLRIGGLDERLWQTADWDLYLKLLFAGEIYYHPQPLACFRIHENSLTMAMSRSEGYRDQLESVLYRHIGKLRGGGGETLRLAKASIDMNVALAAASNGRPGQMVKALMALLALGPTGMLRYIYYSRIFDRALPRLRARLAGAL